MARSVSNTLTAAVNAQETGEVFLVLLTLDHADLAAPIRVVDNNEDIVSGGDTYVAFPFELTLPSDVEGRVPSARLVVDNVDRQIVQAVRSVSSAVDVTIEVILASDPDTIEAGPFTAKLRNIDYDAAQVSGDLVFEEVLSQPYPGQSFNPATTPGLF